MPTTNVITLERAVPRIGRVEDPSLEILERLALAAAFRDGSTHEHNKRVADLTGRLCRVLGQSNQEVEMMRRAAILHDIGKIHIADQILLKPASLSPTEFQTMQSHTTVGAQILGGSNIRVLQLAAEIALSHHERWDGNGYPYGLAGTAIPLSGRIVGVVDVFDALTNERPYKTAWSVEDALEEIRFQSGRLFDPEVVAAFSEVMTGLTVSVPA